MWWCNKNSSNFVANDRADDDGVGSKRSLRWFMEWLAESRGDAKAAGLWQRMGSLCVKVVLSILPTLQREYCQVFERNKNLIEFRKRADATKEAEAASAVAMAGGTFGGSGRADKTARERRSEAAAAAAVAHEAEAAAAAAALDAESSAGGGGRRSAVGGASGGGEAGARAGAGGAGEGGGGGDGVKKEGSLSDAVDDGSHCFELLGVDVMIDSSLKPWLIEINHLPSFATDSPLDLNIKQAVLDQVLRIIRAKPDDKRRYDDARRAASSDRLYAKSRPSGGPAGGPSAGPPSAQQQQQPGGGNAQEKDEASAAAAARKGDKGDFRPMADRSVAAQAAALGDPSSLVPQRPAVSPLETTRRTNPAAPAPGGGGGGGGSTAGVVEVMTVGLARRRICAIYAANCPAKLETVDGLLDKYVGREAKLVAAVEAKYGGAGGSKGEGGDGTARTASASSTSSTSSSSFLPPPTRPGSGGAELSSNPVQQRPGSAARKALRSGGSATSATSAAVPGASLTSAGPGAGGAGAGGAARLKGLGAAVRGGVRLATEAAQDGSGEGWVPARPGAQGTSASGGGSGSGGGGGDAAGSEEEKARRAQGEVCDLGEARRRVDGMYGARWRSGLSAAEHAEVLAWEDEQLEDFDRIFPLPREHVAADSASSSSSAPSTRPTSPVKATTPARGGQRGAPAEQ